jgi:hypothetical protein
MGCGGRWSLTAPADGTDCLLLPSVTPFTAVTDGLSVSAADGRHLAKPVAARVFGLANPCPLARRGRLDKKPPPNEDERVLVALLDHPQVAVPVCAVGPSGMPLAAR